jgi:hypothetical protein
MKKDRRISKNLKFVVSDINMFMSLLVINCKKHKMRNKKISLFISRYGSSDINFLEKLYTV